MICAGSPEAKEGLFTAHPNPAVNNSGTFDLLTGYQCALMITKMRCVR